MQASGSLGAAKKIVLLLLLCIIARVSGQASLSLGVVTTGQCGALTDTWTIAKSGATNGASGVDFTVNVGHTPANQAVTRNSIFAGAINVTNNANSASTNRPITAFVENVVANLQVKPPGSKSVFGTVCSNVITSTTYYNAEVATRAVIVTGATQPAGNPPSGCTGGYVPGSNLTGCYVLNSPKSTDAVPGCGGFLDLVDSNGNSILSAPGATEGLPASTTTLYGFKTDFTVAFVAGSTIRLELIITFGNAGTRGQSDASTNLDINDNGVIDSFENNVRSVAFRNTITSIPSVTCNTHAVLNDVPPPASSDYLVFPGLLGGDVTTNIGTTDAAYDGPGTQTLSSGGSFGVQVRNLQDDAAGNGGSVVNTATLSAGPTNLLVSNGSIQYYCCPGFASDLTASATVAWAPPGTPPPVIATNECTYTQGAYGGKGAPSQLLQTNTNNWAGIPLVIGDQTGVAGATNGYSVTFTSVVALHNYFSGSSGGNSGTLTQDAQNPLALSTGTFGNQIITLAINLQLSTLAGYTAGDFPNLYFCKAGDPMNGLTVKEIYQTCSFVFSGISSANIDRSASGYPFVPTALPGVTSSVNGGLSCNALCTGLNEAFDNCSPGAFSASLSSSPCS